MFTPRLEDAMIDFAVIRTTLETLDFFPTTDPIRGEMEEIIRNAWKRLVFRTESLCIEEKDAYAPEPLTYAQIHSCALEMITKGCPTQNLNAMMKLKVFDETDALYFYELTGFEEMKLARGLPSDLFVRLMFLDIWT